MPASASVRTMLTGDDHAVSRVTDILLRSHNASSPTCPTEGRILKTRSTFLALWIAIVALRKPFAMADAIDAFFDAASNGDIRTVELFLARGGNVNAIKQNTYAGETALQLASASGHIEVVRLLLSKGARVDHKQLSGATALLLASQQGNVEIMRLLLNKGANVNARRFDNETALRLASQKGNLAIMRLLLADHVINNDDIHFALISASETGHLESAK